MSYYGIDYGVGQTNINHKTGIRNGVIPQNDIFQNWADSTEPEYGDPICPKCGNPAKGIDDEEVPDLSDCPDGWLREGDEFVCLDCMYAFDSDQAYGDEPIAWGLDNGEYQAHQGGDDSDIFITESPYFTHAQFCSPCAPGACYLRNPVDDNGPRAYCFAPDWFDYWEKEGTEPVGHFEGVETSCPYPVYRVDTGECIYTPDGWNPSKPR